MTSAAEFEQCIRRGGIVLFPSDTVYGLACDPDSGAAVRRLYDVKGRPPAKASAVMFFSLDAALTALAPSLGGPGHRTSTALQSLMPGGVTVLLENPTHRWPLACAEDPDTLGVRVIDVPALRGVSVPVLQSSANLSGGSEARRLQDVAEPIRAGVDLEIEGGELPGVASTVVDLRGYERGEGWSVLRAGAVGEDELRRALRPQFHFVAGDYDELISADVPGYDELQDCVATASETVAARRILELGTGTGQTARRLLERHPEARLVGIDESEAMLARARSEVDDGRAELRVGRLQDPLPDGPFELVVSALCVHHLEPDEKAALFARVREVMAAGGRFVLADVVVPLDPAEASVSLTPGYDKPDSTRDQLSWLARAGLTAHVVWQQRDLAVIVADLPR